MSVSWRYTIAFIAATITASAISIASYRAGFNQGSNVALCLFSTFQKGMQKQGLDMASPACRSAKQGQNNPLWTMRKRHGMKP